MPTKPKSSKAGRPAGGKPPKAKVKLWVLWEPPAQILVITVIAAIFAGAGLMAIRFSNANAPSMADGQVLWQDGPDATIGSLVSPAAGANAPLQNWRTGNEYVYGGATVRVVPDDKKNEAIEFFGVANGNHPGPYGNMQRAEQLADINLKQGTTYWFGFDLLVAEGGGVTSGRQAIWQILPQPDKSPARLWLAVNSNERGMAVETDSNSLRIGAVPDKDWSRFTIGVHMSDGDDAWFEVWRDGQIAVSRQKLSKGVLPVGASGGVMSAGLYRSPEPWDLRIRMADFKIGTTKEAVQ